MNIFDNLFIIAMITYTVLFAGFLITGIVFSLFRKRSEDRKQMTEGSEPIT